MLVCRAPLAQLVMLDLVEYLEALDLLEPRETEDPKVDLEHLEVLDLQENLDKTLVQYHLPSYIPSGVLFYTI